MLAIGVASNVIVEMLSTLPTAEELENAVPNITEPVSSSYSSVIAGIKNRGKAEKS